MTPERDLKSLGKQVGELTERILNQLAEAHDFYQHTRQAWRVVQQISLEGGSVGIEDTTSKSEVASADLVSMAQRYVTVHLAESVFRSLSGLLEDWICGMARLWLRAYPKQLDTASNEIGDLTRPRMREELQVPLSKILSAPDIEAILNDIVERVVRELAYKKPNEWFRFLDQRVNLGCPDESQRLALCEMKAARDVLEHRRGVVGPDYLIKAGTAARFSVGETVQIDEPYLLERFALLRNVVESMSAAAIRKSSSSSLA